MPLTIHGFPLSTYVRTARMACVEKGVDYDLKPVTSGAAQQQGPRPFDQIAEGGSS